MIAYLIPTRSWYHYATFLLFSMALLAIILIPGVGLTVKGATRWLSLRIFNLQPSEITKFTMMLFLASYLVRRLEEVRQKFSGFVKPMAVVGLIAILLLMEPDYGTLLVLSCAVMGVLCWPGRRLHSMWCLAQRSFSVWRYLPGQPYRIGGSRQFLIPGPIVLERATN